jgi:hypothetical protein
MVEHVREELLVRLDERTKNILEQITILKSEIRSDMEEKNKKIKEQDVKILDLEKKVLEIEPVKKIVYSLVGLILTGFTGGILALLWRSHS